MLHIGRVVLIIGCKGQWDRYCAFKFIWVILADLEYLAILTWEFVFYELSCLVWFDYYFSYYTKLFILYSWYRQEPRLTQKFSLLSQHWVKVWQHKIVTFLFPGDQNLYHLEKFFLLSNHFEHCTMQPNIWYSSRVYHNIFPLICDKLRHIYKLLNLSSPTDSVPWNTSIIIVIFECQNNFLFKFGNHWVFHALHVFFVTGW